MTTLEEERLAATALSMEVTSQALAGVRDRFSAWITTFEDGPKLAPNTNGGPGYSIVWEGGPYEWTYLASMGGRDDFGHEVEPCEVPAGFYLEPVNGWSLNVYPV